MYVIFYCLIVSSFLSLLPLSFASFSLVAHFRLRSVASGLKAMLKECLASLQLGLCARQTTHTYIYTHTDTAGCKHEVFEPNPKNSFSAAVNPTLRTLSVLLVWLIYSTTVKPPFWEKIAKELFSIQMDNKVPFLVYFHSDRFLEVVGSRSDFALLHLSHNRAGVLSWITPEINVEPAAAGAKY